MSQCRVCGEGYQHKDKCTNKQKKLGYDRLVAGGKKGGRAKVPKGFAYDRELASQAGAKGGKKRKSSTFIYLNGEKLTVKEAIAKLEVSRGTIYNKIKAGELETEDTTSS